MVLRHSLTHAPRKQGCRRPNAIECVVFGLISAYLQLFVRTADSGRGSAIGGCAAWLRLARLWRALLTTRL